MNQKVLEETDHGIKIFDKKLASLKHYNFQSPRLPNIAEKIPSRNIQSRMGSFDNLRRSNFTSKSKLYDNSKFDQENLSRDYHKKLYKRIKHVNMPGIVRHTRNSRMFKSQDFKRKSSIHKYCYLSHDRLNKMKSEFDKILNY